MTDESTQEFHPARSHAVERRISLLLLGVLALIGAGIVRVQFDYDPSAWRAIPQGPQNESTGGKGAKDSSRTEEPVLPGLESLSPTETYDAATLSDKIDGKAELYLAAGFRRLESRRFRPVGQNGIWMERYIYDMGSYANAFAVFGAQRRPGSQAVSLTGDAYLAANGLFFVHGPYYVEIVASQSSEAVQAAMTDLARGFVEAHPVSAAAASPLRFLPRQDQVADSASRVAKNAFGLDGFDDIYTAVYRRQDHEAIGFVARRSTTREASAAADRFVNYFTEFGGRLIEPGSIQEGRRIIEVLGTYEVIQTKSPYLFGVHEAGDLQQALTLADHIALAIERAGGVDAAPSQ